MKSIITTLTETDSDTPQSQVDEIIASKAVKNEQRALFVKTAVSTLKPTMFATKIIKDAAKKKSILKTPKGPKKKSAKSASAVNSLDAIIANAQIQRDNAVIRKSTVKPTASTKAIKLTAKVIRDAVKSTIK